ncbi:hypothetical protein AAZV13_01G078950 [Glycine max]
MSMYLASTSSWPIGETRMNLANTSSLPLRSISLVYSASIQEPHNNTKAINHCQVHKDLLNIEMVVGNGQLPQVSHHHQDISMQRYLLMQGSMCLVGLLVEDGWLKTHQVL